MKTLWKQNWICHLEMYRRVWIFIIYPGTVDRTRGGSRASLQVLQRSQLTALENYWKIIPLKLIIIVRTEKTFENDMKNFKCITAWYLIRTLTQSSLPNPRITCKNLVDNSHKAPWATLYSRNGTWWHTRRNQIWFSSETDESIYIGGGVSSVGCWQPRCAHQR